MGEIKYILKTDGGSRGNPGNSAIAYILYNDLAVVAKDNQYIGVATNNVAEYKALILGIKKAIELKIKKLACISDSELMVKQLNGVYKVKDENMKILWGEIALLKRNFENIEFIHTKRENNKETDKMVNACLDNNS